MKSLKRLITVILAISMIVTSLGIVAFAESSFSDITDPKVDEAVAKLVAYGIITGYDDDKDGVAESFKPENQITRAEFAAIVTRMKGVANNLPADSVTGFWDLDADNSRAWARPYVKAAVDLKIINGFEDGSFRAAEPVTYEQAVKMLICAIGYDVIAQSEYNKAKALNPNVSWSAGYIAAANKHGITKNVMTSQITLPANRGIVAVLTSNAVSAPALRDDGNGNLVKDESSSGTTESNMTTISGVVTDTYYTGIATDDTGLAENEIKINATDDELDGTYLLSASLMETIELDKYIGRKVTAYYDNFEREITSIRLENMTSVTIKEEHIVSADATQIRTKDENGKSATENISGATFIVNGKYVDSYDFSDFENGTIEIFASSGRKIVLVNSYKVLVVNYFDRNSKKIYLKYITYDHDNEPSTEEVNYVQLPGRDVDMPLFYVASSGGSYKLTAYSSLSLSQYDVINYLESPSGTDGDPIRKMYVTRGSKSGKVTSGGLNSNRKVELNDKEMYLTQQYLAYDDTGKTDKKAPFELSESYTYYVDYCGQIAAINYSETTSGGSWNYGYLVEGYKRENEVSLIKSDGNIEYYSFKDSVKVDGDKMKGDAVFDALLGAASVVDGNATNDTLTETSGYAQPIKYSISGGKIEAIDTILDGENPGSTGDNFTYDGKFTGTATNTTTTKVTADGESYSVNSSTFVLYVPKDRNDEDAYAKMSASTAFAVEGNRFVEVFGVDSTSTNKLAKMVVVYGLNPTLNFTASTPYFIVTEKGGTGDNATIKGYKNGSDTETTLIVSEDKFTTSIGNHNLVTADELNIGDVIRYIADSKGEVVAIELFYDCDEDAMYNKNGEETYFISESTPSSIMMMLGEVIHKDTTDSNIEIDADGVKTQKYGTTTKVFRLTSEGEIEVTSIEAVSDGSEGMDASKVIAIVRSTNHAVAAQMIYIIEE